MSRDTLVTGSCSLVHAKIFVSMNRKHIAQLRGKAAWVYERGHEWVARVPTKAWIVLGFFGVTAVLMAFHTAMAEKDASLHLKVQHSFRSGQVSVWIDSDLAYSGKLTGYMKKRFGLIPDSVQGSTTQLIPVSSGKHQVRVRIESDDHSAEEDSIVGDFARNAECVLSVSARRSGLSLSWQGTNSMKGDSSGSGWFARYAGSLFLTVAGSIISALTGYAIKELPGQIRSRPNAESKTEFPS